MTLPDAPQLVRDVFGSDVVDRDFRGYEYARKMIHGSTLVAYVGATDRLIQISADAETVVGVGFVCTAPDFRGQGMMKSLLDDVARDAVKRSIRFALLWTGTPSVYASSGYRSAPNLPPMWMVKELTDIPWPDDATVDLRGTW